jgi:hypothetical protein
MKFQNHCNLQLIKTPHICSAFHDKISEDPTFFFTSTSLDFAVHSDSESSRFPSSQKRAELCCVCDSTLIRLELSHHSIMMILWAILSTFFLCVALIPRADAQQCAAGCTSLC